MIKKCKCHWCYVSHHTLSTLLLVTFILVQPIATDDAVMCDHQSVQYPLVERKKTRWT